MNDHNESTYERLLRLIINFLSRSEKASTNSIHQAVTKEMNVARNQVEELLDQMEKKAWLTKEGEDYRLRAELLESYID